MDSPVLEYADASTLNTRRSVILGRTTLAAALLGAALPLARHLSYFQRLQTRPALEFVFVFTWIFVLAGFIAEFLRVRWSPHEKRLSRQRCLARWIAVALLLCYVQTTARSWSCYHGWERHYGFIGIGWADPAIGGGRLCGEWRATYSGCQWPLFGGWRITFVWPDRPRLD